MDTSIHRRKRRDSCGSYEQGETHISVDMYPSLNKIETTEDAFSEDVININNYNNNNLSALEHAEQIWNDRGNNTSPDQIFKVSQGTKIQINTRKVK